MKSNQHNARDTPHTLKVTSMGTELHRTEDELGTILVIQRDNKRLLSFDSMLEQSCVLIKKPYYLMHKYTQAMLLGLLFSKAERVALLGLGGGGLVHCLTHFFPQTLIQVVEIRKAVIDIAYTWFNLPKHENLTVINADAYAYVAAIAPKSNDTLLSDLIFSDLYEANGMSACQAQQDFIASCCQALSQSGCLVLNFHQLPSPDSTLIKIIKQLFKEVLVYDAGNKNSIIFCCKNTVNLHQPKLDAQAKTLSKQVEMDLVYYYRELERW